MKVHGCTSTINPNEPRAVAIGLFDGLHLGHSAVIRRMLEVGKKRGLASTVLTFDIWSGSKPSPKPAGERLLDSGAFESRLRAMGIHTLARLPFDVVRDLSPEQFAREILAGALCTKAIFCGENFRFGKNAAGGAKELCALGGMFGFSAEALTLVEHEGEPISSTRIRLCMKLGKTDAVNAMLGL
jgi:riboflavin kinase/FMN adenylyltransferase